MGARDDLYRVDEQARDEVIDLLDAEERILAEQFLAQPKTESPEKALCLAILMQAIADATDRRWVRGGGGDVREARRAEALDWIRSDDETHVFSFASIASVFGWDVGHLRAGILKRLEAGALRLPRMTEPPPKRIGDTRYRPKKTALVEAA